MSGPFSTTSLRVAGMDSIDGPNYYFDDCHDSVDTRRKEGTWWTVAWPQWGQGGYGKWCMTCLTGYLIDTGINYLRARASPCVYLGWTEGGKCNYRFVRYVLKSGDIVINYSSGLIMQSLLIRLLVACVSDTSLCLKADRFERSKRCQS